MRSKIAIVVSLILMAGVLLQTQWYRFRPEVDIPGPILSTLRTLANQALEAHEVPIGAVLVYHDTIIGKGYNTVVRDTNLSAHAEINALVDAHRHYWRQWPQMDRANMVMYSTYEPCEMCKGAMLNLNISQVVFEGAKPMMEQVLKTSKSWGYEAQKRRLFAPGLQDSLFWRHPDFPASK